MKKKILFALCLIPVVIFSQASFEEKVTSVSNVGMTINNLGMIGNAFGGSFDVEGYPSCEFPVNSGVEHLFDGGLWIGAKINGVNEVVTTGAVDAVSGFATGGSGFEFSAPLNSGLDERSSLFNSPLYNPTSVSHQDFYSIFSDTAIKVPGTNIEIRDHEQPLGVEVEFESYNWNFPFANFFVILNYKITNIGNNDLEDLHLAFWMDGVVRNVNVTPPGGTPFFNKGGNGFLDSLSMGYEFDAAGDLGFTETYIGLKFLGSEDKLGFHHPQLDSSFNCHYNSWQFLNSADPLTFYPTDDPARYGKMTNGLNYYPNFTEQDWDDLKTPNNRSTLISVGPYTTLYPGESIDLAFAVVCAKKNGTGPGLTDSPQEQQNLIKNAGWAQTAYNGEDANFNGVLDPGEDRDGNGVITRFILPSPPDIPETRIELSKNTIDLYWTKNAENSVDPISKTKDFEGFRIYKTSTGFDVQSTQDLLRDLKLIKEVDLGGNGLFNDTGLEEVLLSQAVVFEGDSNEYYYKYTIENVLDGWQHAIAVTSFDGGDEVNNLESLESSPLSNLKRVFTGTPPNEDLSADKPFVYPNPYYGKANWEGASTFEEDRKLNFANLPARCQIRIYSAAGDLVKTIDHDEAYDGRDIKWFETYSNPENIQFPGGEHSWDLLSNDNQIIARGIYLFSVVDLDTDEKAKGKFVIIK